MGEFIEGVGEDDQLEMFVGLFDEFYCVVQWIQGVDYFLDVWQVVVVLVEDVELYFYQFIVVGNVSGGGVQFVDIGVFGEVDLDFWNQYFF